LLPIQIGWTEDLVAVVGLVAVVVGDIGAVTGEVHKQYISALPAADQPHDGLLDGRLRGVEVGEEGNVTRFEPVLLLEQFGHVLYVGHAAAQIRSWNAVAVDADQDRLLRHFRLLYISDGQKLRAPVESRMRSELPVFRSATRLCFAGGRLPAGARNGDDSTHSVE
jgi:hypothetical protein